MIAKVSNTIQQRNHPQPSTCGKMSGDHDTRIVVEIDSQDLALERGFYVESLKHLDKYYDIFNNPNTCKKSLLTIFISLLILMTTVCINPQKNQPI